MTDTAQDIPADVNTFGNPPIVVEDVVDADGNTYCQVHTETETGLRCNNCTRLMCAKCAVSTPVGYRCEQCVRERERGFFNADTAYYVRLVGVCVTLGTIGAFVADAIGFFIFVFFVASFAGGIISEAAMRVTKGKRGRYAGEAAAAGVVAGSVIAILLSVLPVINAVGNTITPEMAAQLTEQYGPERADQIIQEFRQQQSSFTRQVIGAAFFNFSVWLYTVIAAVAVYGRFNIYGGRRKR